MRGKGLGRRPGESPQSHLGNRVAHEFGRQLVHTLINHVHHESLGLRLPIRIRNGFRGLGGQGLRQHDRCAQVGLDVAVPAFAGHAVDIVVFEDRGIVDQHRDRLAKRLGRAGQQGLRLRLVQQVCLQRHGLSANLADRGGGFLGLRFGPCIVHGHVVPRLGQRQRHGPAQPLRRPRHQCRHDRPPLSSEPG